MSNSTSDLKYIRYLKAVASFSGLFSDNTAPYIVYRAVERCFSEAYNHKDVSRSDVSVDCVSQNKVGYGVKTFLKSNENPNSSKTEKIAEFNRDSPELRITNDPVQLVHRVSELWNRRLHATKGIFGLVDLRYHLVVRSISKISVYETPMPFIDTDSIVEVVESRNSVHFKSGNNQFTFNRSKNTLFKTFVLRAEDIVLSTDITILANPLQILSSFISGELTAKQGVTVLSDTPHLQFTLPMLAESKHWSIESVVLPLYSVNSQSLRKGTQSFAKKVQERAGINQWNASGRPRSLDEMYIPVPTIVHEVAPNFFPGRDIRFALHTPDGSKFSAKICQGGDKALMTDPNSGLADWLLRKTLGLEAGKLASYRDLSESGFDCVLITRQSDGVYSIDVLPIGSFEEFIQDRLSD